MNLDISKFSSEDEIEYKNFAEFLHICIIRNNKPKPNDGYQYGFDKPRFLDMWQQFPKKFAPNDTLCKKKLLQYLEKYVDISADNDDNKFYFTFDNPFKSWSDLQKTAHKIWKNCWNVNTVDSITTDFITYKELRTIKDLPTWFMPKNLDHYIILLGELFQYKEKYFSYGKFSVRLDEKELKFIFIDQPTISGSGSIESKSINDFPIKLAQNESTACSICLVNEKNVVYSCGHAMCSECVKKLEKQECPFCKKSLENPIELFLTV